MAQLPLAGFNPRTLWKRYAVALSLIALCLLTTHLVQGWSLSRARNDAVWINDSGLQRSYASRILHQSLKQINAPSLEQGARLMKMVAEMESAHFRLSQMPGMSERLKAHYFDARAYPGSSLDPLVRRYLQDAKLIAEAQDVGRAAAYANLEALGSGLLHTKLDEAVTILEEEALRKSQVSGRIQSWSFWGAVILLFIEAGAIFYPTQRLAVRAVDALKEANAKLAKQSERYKLANEKLLNLSEKNETAALHDPLTGLPNRRYLDEALSSRSAAAKAENATVTVMHVDLDRFKQINDTLGHAAGDFILKRVADVLRDRALAESFIARVGGDEFVILAPDNVESQALVNNAEAIINALGEPVLYQGTPCYFGASIGIGIASAKAGSADINRLLEDADIALYRAKEHGRGRVEVFSQTIKQEFEETKQISDDLLVAFGRDELMPDYQLQFCAKTQEIVGAEALARWHHPTRGKLAPAAFLDVAVSMNLMPRLDQVMLEKSKANLALFDAFGKPIPRIAINLSAPRLDEADFFTQIETIGIDPTRFCFELTETIRLESISEVAKANIRRLQEAGFDLEIDDFGTGHASILSLLNLRPKRVKIARELIQPLEEGPGHEHFLRQLIELAKTMDLDVVCEGVESADTGARLAEMGCDILQGYAYAMPVSPGRLVETFDAVQRTAKDAQPLAAAHVKPLAA